MLLIFPGNVRDLGKLSDLSEVVLLLGIIKAHYIFIYIF